MNSTDESISDVDGYPAKSVLLRLIGEGLDRHGAVHAIGSVLADQIFVALQPERARDDLAANYLEELERLTAQSWKSQGSNSRQRNLGKIQPDHALPKPAAARPD